jgi:N-acetylglucosamine malate deacetylase 1
MNAQTSSAGRLLASRYADRTVLAVGAHPDDMELGAGGTLAQLSRAGARVVMAVVSIPADFETRRAEAHNAARILGAELRILMDGRPRRVEDVKHYELVGMLDSLVRELRPAAVLTHGGCDFHRDHVTVYSATLPSQRLQYFDFFSYSPTMCRPVPVSFHPRLYVDITESIEIKMEAIAAHASQFGCRGLGLELYRDTARLNGHMVAVEYAEGFDVGRMLLG